MEVTPVVYLAALDRVIERVASFNPDWLVISAGTDTAEHDPVGNESFQLI